MDDIGICSATIINDFGGGMNILKTDQRDLILGKLLIIIYKQNERT